MSKSVPIAALAAVCFALGSGAQPLDASLSRNELQHRFNEWRAAGSVRIDAPLEWAYLFASGDARALESLSLRLVEDGYRIASLRSAPASSSELRVTRVEQHTPMSLARRNGELAALARRYSGVTYVGAVPKPVH